MALLSAPPAMAADASPWIGDAHARARLIAGGAAADGTLRAGVEIDLARGWMTYWRYPGDAGVPPRFDFAGSINLAAATVLWPAPERIEKSGITSIGYDEPVIFPLRVTAQDPSRPVNLRVRLTYGICEKVCIPAEADASIAIGAATTGETTAIVRAEAQVPRPTAIGAEAVPGILTFERQGREGRIRLRAPAVDADVFVEGPTDEWALPVPQRSPDDPSVFTFALEGAPAGASYDGVPLTLTVTSPRGAVEVTTRLD